MKTLTKKIGLISLMCVPMLVGCNTPSSSSTNSSASSSSSSVDAGSSTSSGETSSSSVSSSSSTTSVDSSSTSSSYTNVEAKCTGQSGETMIKFWHALNSTNLVPVTELTNKFNALHAGPGGYCVETVSQTSYENIKSTMKAAIQAGTALPDLATTYADHVAEYQAGGVVVDMKPFMDAHGSTYDLPAEYAVEGETINMYPNNYENYVRRDYNYTDILQVYRDESESYKFAPADFEEGKSKMYSLPLNKSTEVMYYNKTFFDIWTGRDDNYAAQGTRTFTVDGQTGTAVQLGLKHPDSIVVSDKSTWFTWDDIETNAKIIKEITRTQIDPTEADPRYYRDVTIAGKKFSNQNGNPTFSYDSVSNLFVTLANQVNSYTSLKVEGNNVVPELNFNSPTALEAYGMYEDMYKNGYATLPALIDSSFKYSTDAFNAKMLFMTVGSVAGANLNTKNDFEVGVAPIPQMDVNNPKVIQQGTNITMIAQRDQNTGDVTNFKQRAAFEYVKFLTSEVANLEYAMQTTYLPTRTSVLESEEYAKRLDSSKGTAAVKGVARALNVSVNQSEAYFFDPAFVGSGTLRDNAEDVIVSGLRSTTRTLAQAIEAYYIETKTLLGIK